MYLLHSIYYNETYLSSNSAKGADEPNRIRRLERISDEYEIMHSRLLINPSNIISLHDSTGRLTVMWEKEPTEEEKTLVSSMWKLEKQNSIEHKAKG